MTPGEAAVMNTSSTSRPVAISRRLAMSRSTAGQSFQAMGPVQAGWGMFREDMWVCVAANSGKSASSRRVWERTARSPPKPVSRSLT